MLPSNGSNIRVLQLMPKVCWPLDTGAKLRNYHLARVLSEHSQITLLTFADDDLTSENLETVYQKIIKVPRDRGYTPEKILRGALGRIPLPVLNYTTDAMKAALRRVLAENQFDIVQVESIHLFGYLPIIRSCPHQPLAVCDWHNIESELMLRYSEREASFLRRAYARKTAVQLQALERAAMQQFDVHVVVSHRDGERLQKLNPAALTYVIENGVDTAYYSDNQIATASNMQSRTPHAAKAGDSSRDRPQRVVFVGSMDYHANVDGAVNFAKEIWPLIHKRKPKLTFTIVGRNPTAPVVELKKISGIEVTGSVDDVRPYYREAVVAIVPLRVGGGSRLKILEAMAAGVPVVSTSLGAEGLDVLHNENILIADTAEQLVDAIIGVVDNDGLQKQLRTGGRTLVSSVYDWSSLGARLFEIYRGLSAGSATVGAGAVVNHTVS